MNEKKEADSCRQRGTIKHSYICPFSVVVGSLESERQFWQPATASVAVTHWSKCSCAPKIHSTKVGVGSLLYNWWKSNLNQRVVTPSREQMLTCCAEYGYIWVVKFSRLQNWKYPQEILNFENWCNGKVKKCLNLTLRINFQCQKSKESSSFFFIEEYQFRSTFVVIDILW